MRTYSLLAIIFVLAFPLPSFTSDASPCLANLLERVYQDFIKDRAHLAEDVFRAPESTGIYMGGRLAGVVQSIPEDKLHDFLSQLSKENITEMFDYMSANSAIDIFKDKQTATKADDFITDLYNFLVLDDNFGPWMKEKNVSATFLEKLKSVEKIFNSVSSDYMATVITEDSITLAEQKMFQRLINEYKGTETFTPKKLARMWESWKRFWFPYYSRARSVIEFDEGMRKRMQLNTKLDDLVRDVLDGKKTDIKLTANDREEFKVFLSDTPEELTFVRDELKRVWGKEISKTEPLKAADIEIYMLAKKTNKGEELGLELAQKGQRLVEEDLDQFQSILNKIRKRTGLPDRKVSDFDEKELRIRYQQRTRIYDEKKNLYYDTTSEKAGVSYVVERRHTRQIKTGTDAKGNPTYRTEVYYVDDRVYPSYETILEGSYDTGDRFVSGLTQIQESASKFVEKENPFRDKLIEISRQFQDLESPESYQELIKDSQKIQEKISTLVQDHKGLVEAEKKFSQYLNWTDKEILKQWPDDNPEHFRKRNQILLEQIQNVRDHTENIAEQITRKTASLNPEYTLPDYTNEMDYLRKKMITAHSVKLLTAAASAGGAVTYSTNKDKIDPKAKELFHKLRGLITLETKKP